MGKTKKRLNWRSFAQEITGVKDLHAPDVQKKHPVMQAIADLMYWNALEEDEQNAIEGYFSRTGHKAPPIKSCLKVARGGKIDKEELIELLYTGLLDDTGYQSYIETKEQKPGINALDFFNYTKDTEKDRAVLKLAAIFEALLDEDDVDGEYQPFVSRAEFEQMKSDIGWVKKNLKSIEKSKPNW